MLPAKFSVAYKIASKVYDMISHIKGKKKWYIMGLIVVLLIVLIFVFKQDLTEILGDLNG
jgi:hypothetical protein